MIVRKRFPSDENNTLMLIQHDTYHGPEGVGLLCGEAIRRYSNAVSLLSVTTELWQAINEHDSKFYLYKQKSSNTNIVYNLSVAFNEVGVNGQSIQEPIIAGFDHRVLQSSYDTIAAWFRFCNPELWLPLFPCDEIMKDVNLAAWRKFWSSEVKRLIDKDEITIAILTAVAYQNREKGFAAERELNGLLRLEYEEMFTTGESNKET
jgi:hypothetical protein